MKNTFKLTQPKLLAVMAAVLAALPALAQNFNIDFGNAFGVPGSGYSGAAMMPVPCFWNNPPGSAPFPLIDNSGAPTPAQIWGGALGPLGCAGAPVVSPHARLLDDGLVTGPYGAVQVFTVGPLVAGHYEVFTYAFSPCMPGYITQVFAPGSISPAQNIGGPWPGGLLLGVTHARHSAVPVGPGGYIQIQLVGITPLGFGSLNGLQIVWKP